MANPNQPKGCFGCLFLLVLALTLILGFSIGWEPLGAWLSTYKVFSAGVGVLLLGLFVIAYAVETNKRESPGGAILTLIGVVVIIVGLVLFWSSPAEVPPTQPTAVVEPQPEPQPPEPVPPQTPPQEFNWAALILGILMALVGGGIIAGNSQPPRPNNQAAGCGCWVLFIGVVIAIGAFFPNQNQGQNTGWSWWTQPTNPTPTSPDGTTEPGGTTDTPPMTDQQLWWANFWEGIGSWSTVVFFGLWAVFGLGGWAALEKDRRGPFRKVIEEGRAAAIIPILGAVWLLYWLGGDLVPVASAGLQWVREVGSWTAVESPNVVLPLVFLGISLLAMPLQLNHQWKDPWKRQEHDWYRDLHEEFSNRAILQGLILFAVEVLCLFWVTAAVGADPGNWPVEIPGLLLPLAGDWERFGLLIGLFALEVGVYAGVFVGIQGALKWIADRRPYGSPARDRDWTTNWRYAFARELLLYLPTLWVFMTYEKANPYLLTIVMWFAAARVATTCAAELLSWVLDIVHTDA